MRIDIDYDPHAGEPKGFIRFLNQVFEGNAEIIGYVKRLLGYCLTGETRLQAFLVGAMSGAVEPLGAIAMILLASILTPLMPWFLSFAAGAMMYVVIEELIPETAEGEHSNLGTIGFAAGFALMMVLDVVFG